MNKLEEVYKRGLKQLDDFYNYKPVIADKEPQDKVKPKKKKSK